MNKISIFLKKVRSRFLKIAWHIKCLFVKETIEIFTLIDGSKLKYPINSTIGRLLFTKNFETEEIKFLLSSLKAGDIFFDVGANGGIFTLIAAKKVENEGHVYSFEPGIPELDLLKQNIELNQLTNVTVIDSAVSNNLGKTNFAVSKDGAMNSLFQTEHPLQDVKEWKTVSVTTLDNFISAHKIDKVDFLKIDVEGAEQLVFEGADSLISSSFPPIIMFESCDANFSSELGYKAKDVLRKLFNKGFKIDAVVNYKGLVPLEYSLEMEIPSYNFVATKPNDAAVNIKSIK